MSALPAEALARPIGVGSVLLELKGICKSFGSVHALNMVDLTVRAGEIHAIVGENGAGKSTLVTIAAGALAADTGTILVRGKAVANTGVRAMRQVGVAIAYQHPALPPDLTVLESLSLAAPDLASRDGAARAAALLASVATPMLSVSLDQQIGDLTLAQRHIVEIARALATDPDVIVFDEPTEPLQETDVKRLFEVIAGLKQAGKGIVYISHRLNDVRQIADRVSVLRDGGMVATNAANAFSESEIVNLIAGRSLSETFPLKGKSSREGLPALRVKRASGDNFSDVNLEVFAGEIVGLVGVEGQGQREFIRAIAGASGRRDGELYVLDQSVARQGRMGARNAGLGFVPDDRHYEGLFLPLSVRENLSVGQLALLGSGGYVAPAREAAAVQRDIDTFRIRTSGPAAAVATLSGGNQQKVLLAREIAARPRALLLDEPTKGVDVGSRSEIYQRLRELAESNVGVLVCSSDGVELEGLCDRVLVFSRGRIVRELVGDEVTDANITAANLGATTLRATETGAKGAWSSLGRLFSGVYMPIAALCVLIAIVATVTGSLNPKFLTPLSLTPALALASILIFVSFAQLSVVLIGEFDLSVGPLTGLVVVMASFLIPDGGSLPVILIGSVGVVLICTAIGFLQGLAIFCLRLPSIVVTLATFFGFQGVSLLLRPLPAGYIEARLLDAFTYPVAYVPIVFVVAVAIGIVLERALFRWPVGREARASGSSQPAALKLGVSRIRIGLIAFTTAGCLTGLAGLILAAEVGYGIAGLGVDYTLMSVTAVVLGGAAITGGLGSFIATLFGALLVQIIISATPFLQIGSEWNYWITGATTLLAGGLFGLARSRRAP